MKREEERERNRKVRLFWGSVTILDGLEKNYHEQNMPI